MIDTNNLMQIYFLIETIDSFIQRQEIKKKEMCKKNCVKKVGKLLLSS